MKKDKKTVEVVVNNEVVKITEKEFQKQYLKRQRDFHRVVLMMDKLDITGLEYTTKEDGTYSMKLWKATSLVHDHWRPKKDRDVTKD